MRTLVSAVLIFVVVAVAQQPGPEGGLARARPVAGIQVSGLLDGYYSRNLQHPASGANLLRNFDVRTNRLSLNMAKLVLDRSPQPLES